MMLREIVVECAIGLVSVNALTKQFKETGPSLLLPNKKKQLLTQSMCKQSLAWVKTHVNWSK